MKSLPLKYVSTCIALQEVPDEISLIINISGCPHHCEGCHSQYLWEYTGNYLSDDILVLIDRRREYVSCVCIMGGDYNIAELNYVMQCIKSKGLKTCLYTGLNYIPAGLDMLDYIKIGEYKKELGGLDKLTTNQRFYKNVNGQYKDITNVFQTKEMLYVKDNQESR